MNPLVFHYKLIKTIKETFRSCKTPVLLTECQTHFEEWKVSSKKKKKIRERDQGWMGRTFHSRQVYFEIISILIKLPITLISSRLPSLFLDVNSKKKKEANVLIWNSSYLWKWQYKVDFVMKIYIENVFKRVSFCWQREVTIDFKHGYENKQNFCRWRKYWILKIIQ